MKEIEIERVFLIREIPKDLEDCKKIIIRVGDFFEPNRVDALKIKQKGDRFFLVKKEGDLKHIRVEHNIDIKEGEFEVLWKVTLQNHEKLRYLYSLGDNICEIDFYQGSLKGYVRLEVEFKTEKEMNDFKVPDWFGQEITEFNHEIHEDLGKATFAEMKKRYADKGIVLKKIGFS
jgi:CYTH domain-containing protein